MHQVTILNIQKFSIHDGDGIRTSVFFKGCPLSCKWCHNPESKKFTKELMYNIEKCNSCGICASVCPTGAIKLNYPYITIDRVLCNHCNKCCKYCHSEALEIAGKAYTVSEIIKEIEKDRMFYEVSGGGVTLTGGEVLSQPKDFLYNLVRSLHRRGYDIAIDTSGYADFDLFEIILPYVKTFLYDLKFIDNKKHVYYTGKSNESILENLRKLSLQNVNIYLRLPIINNINSSNEDIIAIIDFLNTGINISQINLLPYHDFGVDKLPRLGDCKLQKVFESPTKKRLFEIESLFVDSGYKNIKIGG